MPNSAYNFVPLADRVFFPDWSNKVSMDIPFEDGISGELTIELRADTDIYTRESYPRTENPDNNRNQKEFFKITPNGEYAIPGTSIKGVIRNVLEIASFSKIKADDKRYSVRDLSNPDPNLYTNQLTETVGRKIYKPKVRAGWLIENDLGEHFIIPCYFARIEQDEINRRFHLRLGYRKENAKDKYNALNRNHGNLNQRFMIGDLVPHPHHDGMNLVYRIATFSNNQNSTEGTLVFTGQAAGRPNVPNPKSHPKHLEFVFFNANNDSRIRISDNLYKEFCFIHSTVSNVTKPNEEWEYWKRKMQNGERVPVFYMEDRNGVIKSMGLSMMYRLAYNYSIKEAIMNTSDRHFSTKKDFAETLLGYVDDKDALRGRVAFSTMTLRDMPNNKRTEITTVLGSPKPTFYPYYILQTQNGRYNTFMNDNCKINGWKRYPYQPRTNEQPATPEQQNNVATTFRPLPQGSIFEGKIHLHNVKVSELGGLIWALRFGNNPGCHHSVGMAKPYGFGAATIRITGGRLFFNNTMEERDAIPELDRLQLSFVKMMEINIDNWSKSEQILNLLALAQTYTGNTNIEYPKLIRGNNEFVNIKRERVTLPRHLTNNLRTRLETTSDTYLAPINNEIEQGKKEKEAKELAIKEQEEKELELKKQKEAEEQKRQQELAAKAEAERKAAMTPEELAREEYMPKYLEVKSMFEKQKQKPFNISQCSFFKDIYDICSKFKAPETLELLKDLQKYAETGPKKNKKIKEIKDKIKELFPDQC